MRKVGVWMVLGGLLTALAWAAPFWEKKPFLKWSEKECRKLLSDSPWAQAFTLTGISIPAPMARDGSVGRNRGVDPAGDLGDREVYRYLQLQFLSARPVRAAMARLQILANPAAPGIEEQMRSWVDQPASDQIAVGVTYYSRPSGHSSLREIDAFFRTSTLEQIQSRCYLTHSESGTSVPLSGYHPPGDANPMAVLVFPRTGADGTPHFSGREKTILLRLEAPFGEIEQRFHPDEMHFDEDFAM